MNRERSRTRRVLTRVAMFLVAVYIVLAFATRSPLRALAFEAIGLVVVWLSYAGRFGFNDPRALLPEVLWFRLKDRRNRPERNLVVFTGSSTIAHWTTLSEDMAPVPVLNRGINGARIHQVTHFANRIILPYGPRAVVLYAGENDISGFLGSTKKSADDVLKAFREFCDTIHGPLPTCPIYFIPIKPPMRRSRYARSFEVANKLVEQHCTSDSRLHFIDVIPAMLGTDGRPRADLYERDGIHLNEAGYRVLTSIVKPCLATSLSDVDH